MMLQQGRPAVRQDLPGQRVHRAVEEALLPVVAAAEAADGVAASPALRRFPGRKMRPRTAPKVTSTT